LPCTPLGIVKALQHMGRLRAGAPPRTSAEGVVATIFNRSEVVGRPLAAMLAHDGARVYSFDIDGVQLYEARDARPFSITRAEALAASNVVVTGVPSRDFPPVRAAEIQTGASCINFSHFNNLGEDIAEAAGHLLKRVGPITVAMLLRNTLRLYRNFHAG
jgi:methylenetetrahydrofolate dehydrogenase (NADP+)/methenyltetrahydrofolate cyclohydrolase